VEVRDGIRFDISIANWLAYLIEPEAPIPRMESPWMERETLRMFLYRLRNQFYSTKRREREFSRTVEGAERLLHELDSTGSNRIPPQILSELRADLGARPWTALIVPTGSDWELDNFLASEDFLLRLIGIRSDEPGLVLQLEGPFNTVFSLTDIFPAFRTALAESTRWPGILLWTPYGDSSFLPFQSRSTRQIEERAAWVLSQLSYGLGADLELLAKEYFDQFSVGSISSSVINLLHLSDLHLGSKEAMRRLPRVQQLIRNLLNELDEKSTIVPVVSGDLMDTPSDDHLDAVRGFVEFLTNLGTEKPVVVLGNHDVRQNGYVSEQLKQALQLTVTQSMWLKELHIAILCFNSSIEGKLARGYIGERQLIDVGNEIDRTKDWRDYFLVGVLHHHPIPVERPDWYKSPFYERLLGRQFERTDELEDANDFIEFMEARNFGAILHGHKHIPRVDETPNRRIPVYGCGSTVGKVDTVTGRTYMSMNVVTINPETGQLAGRLLAERIPGTGLQEQKRHELVYRRELQLT
jgi:hypothetical protein